MLLSEIFSEPTNLSEGPLWDKIKKGAITGAAATSLGYAALHNVPQATSSPPSQEKVSQLAAEPMMPPSKFQKPEVKKPPVHNKLPRLSHISKNIHEENLLKKAAIASGIKGVELAAFLAQCNHESADFENMEEIGDKKYFTSKYDPKFAPRTAEILGNVKHGDGVKYRGRGFIQITGRDNYSRAGDALDLPLEQHPELAEKPSVAAQIAVWFWLSRVRPNVTDFSNVEQVTHSINPALHNLDARIKSFEAYLRLI